MLSQCISQIIEAHKKLWRAIRITIRITAYVSLIFVCFLGWEVAHGHPSSSTALRTPSCRSAIRSKRWWPSYRPIRFCRLRRCSPCPTARRRRLGLLPIKS
jgi:hypothetical protein